VLHAYQLYYNEHALSIISTKLGDDPSTYYILGTAYVTPKNSTGRIIVFHYDESLSKLKQITEKRIDGACFSLFEYKGKLGAIIKCVVSFNNIFFNIILIEYPH